MVDDQKSLEFIESVLTSNEARWTPDWDSLDRKVSITPGIKNIPVWFLFGFI